MDEKHKDDWLNYIEFLHPKPIDMRTSRFERLQKVCNILGILPWQIPVITVAGTNGKGSTVAAMESILSTAGYKTGAYTSPHLLSFNERIRVDQKTIDDQTLCEAFQQIETARGSDSLTYFEFATIAALWIFFKHQLDVVILEVGMGGRLDAVNLIDPDVAVITTISIDHVEWLGNTREAIGFEKAGIMRPQKPVICGDFNVPQSIRDCAKNCGAYLFCQNEHFGYTNQGDVWEWWGSSAEYSNLPLPKIELQNAATAIQALNCLNQNFVNINLDSIKKGLSRVFVPGRFHVIEKNILDVAHNPESISLLARRLAEMPIPGKTLAVVAMLSDKDIPNSIKPMLKEVDQWYVSGLEGNRGNKGEVLANFLKESGVSDLKHFDSVLEAYTAAKYHAAPHDRIVIFGSFHTVEPVLKELS